MVAPPDTSATPSHSEYANGSRSPSVGWRPSAVDPTTRPCADADGSGRQMSPTGRRGDAILWRRIRAVMSCLSATIDRDTECGYRAPSTALRPRGRRAHWGDARAGIRAHSGTAQRLLGPVDLASFDSTAKVRTEGSGKTSRHPGAPRAPMALGRSADIVDGFASAMEPKPISDGLAPDWPLVQLRPHATHRVVDTVIGNF